MLDCFRKQGIDSFAKISGQEGTLLYCLKENLCTKLKEKTGLTGRNLIILKIQGRQRGKKSDYFLK